MSAPISSIFVRQAAASAALGALFALAAPQARADLVWNWSYSGAGITAGGTLTTADAADAHGFHQITGITGTRNGQAITGLYPTGSAIPGNEPYALDNLIRSEGEGRLTVHGLGFALADGTYANPFYADFLATPGYLEVLTTAGGGFSEVPIIFTASPVPEPAALALMLAGLGAVALRHRPARAGTDPMGKAA